ncbi:hypothetical protein TEA_013920 [Camellia sinensis var. sinensis]|uniref:O-acyltransferase WSD1 C-terminal domain-containing protein n=1 Tax=Camellia sinensis var. sinensis TaxID=542762 RepID=A0A4S4EGC8_CAMSN|nr:hypothetical protein TEA_013920 [Camellia sinensis var. sinensis]
MFILQVFDKESGKLKWAATELNVDDHVVPLWDLHILDIKTSDSEGVIVYRVHHSIGDGTSLMALLLACSRKVSDPEALPSIPVMKTSSLIKNSGFWSVLQLVWNTIIGVLLFVATSLFLKDTETRIKASKRVEKNGRRIIVRNVNLDDVKSSDGETLPEAHFRFFLACPRDGTTSVPNVVASGFILSDKEIGSAHFHQTGDENGRSCTENRLLDSSTKRKRGPCTNIDVSKNDHDDDDDDDDDDMTPISKLKTKETQELITDGGDGSDSVDSSSDIENTIKKLRIHFPNNLNTSGITLCYVFSLLYPYALLPFLSQAFSDMMEKGNPVRWGNNIGYVVFPFTIGFRDDPLDYVREAKVAIDRKKSSLEPFWVAFLTTNLIKFFGNKVAGYLNYKVFSNTTLWFSNVPGTGDEIAFCGHEISYYAPTCYGQPNVSISP